MHGIKEVQYMHVWLVLKTRGKKKQTHMNTRLVKSGTEIHRKRKQRNNIYYMARFQNTVTNAKEKGNGNEYPTISRPSLLVIL